MEKQEYTTDEIFALLPNLKTIFENYQKQIRYPQSRFNKTKEEIIRERNELLSVVQKLDLIDLKIIFLLRRTKSFSAVTLYKALYKIHETQKELEKLLKPPAL